MGQEEETIPDNTLQTSEEVEMQNNPMAGLVSQLASGAVETAEEEEEKPEDKKPEEEKPEEDKKPEEEEEEKPEEEEEKPSKEEEEEELTEEEIQAKLDELDKKDEDKLTEDEKQFIEDNTLTAKDRFYQTIGEEEGINLEDYDNSLEGVAELSKDIVAKRSETVAKQMLQDTMNEVPEIGMLYKHVVEEGKSLETFLLKHHEADYSKIDITNEDGQKQLLTYYYKTVKNLDDKATGSLVEIHANGGKLLEDAKTIKAEMDTIREQQIKEITEKENAFKAQQEAKNKEAIARTQKIIRSRNIGGLKLTEKEAKAFEKQIFEFDSKANQSLVEKSYSQMSEEERLILDYLTVNKDKLKSLFKSKAKVSRDKTLDDDFKTNKKRSGLKQTRTSTKGGKDDKPVETLDPFKNGLDNFFQSAGSSLANVIEQPAEEAAK